MIDINATFTGTCELHIREAMNKKQASKFSKAIAKKLFDHVDNVDTFYDSETRIYKCRLMICHTIQLSFDDKTDRTEISQDECVDKLFCYFDDFTTIPSGLLQKLTVKCLDTESSY